MFNNKMGSWKCKSELYVNIIIIYIYILKNNLLIYIYIYICNAIIYLLCVTSKFNPLQSAEWGTRDHPSPHFFGSQPTISGGWNGWNPEHPAISAAFWPYSEASGEPHTFPPSFRVWRFSALPLAVSLPEAAKVLVEKQLLQTLGASWGFQSSDFGLIRGFVIALIKLISANWTTQGCVAPRSSLPATWGDIREINNSSWSPNAPNHP